jgi:hypothetical protein
MIYSGQQVPAMMYSEYPGEKERGMRNAYQIVVKNNHDRLDPRSRINLRAIHCCQKNWKVHEIGTITIDSWNALCADHQAVLDGA